MKKIIDAPTNRDTLTLDELIEIFNSEIKKFYSRTKEKIFNIYDKCIDEHIVIIKKLCEDSGWEVDIKKHNSENYGYTITLKR